MNAERKQNQNESRGTDESRTNQRKNIIPRWKYQTIGTETETTTRTGWGTIPPSPQGTPGRSSTNLHT